MRSILSRRGLAFGLLLLGAAFAGCQCGTRPVPDQVSSGFQMSRDSLSFPNFAAGYDGSELDVDGMKRMFGDQVCVGSSSPCELTNGARTFMENANTAMSGGRCEGFAVLADLMAAKKIDVSTFGAKTARELVLDENPALQKELAYWFATQLVPGAVGAKTKTYTAREVLPVLADSFDEGATEHYRIGIVRKVGKIITGGHSLTPIGFTRDPSAAGVYWLRVYDNNHPDLERLMKLDTVNNRWEFEASTNPDQPSRLYFGDSTNENPLYLAPIFTRQGALPCPFCEGGGAQVVTTGGAQPSITTPSGTVGVTDGTLSAASGTSLTPSFSDPTDAEGVSFVIGLSADTMSSMGDLPVQVTSQGDPQNPDALQTIGVQRRDLFTQARGLQVTAADTFTATSQGGRYTNASRSPLELTTRLPTGMGVVSITAFVTGGSDSVSASVDPASGTLTLQLTGAMGTNVGVTVQGTTSGGATRAAQFFFTSQGTATLQADTTMWMQGGQLTGSLDNGGTRTTVSNACTDGVKSGLEPDVDCGAACNVGCGVGKSCGADADCGSGLCHPTSKVCITDACEDTRQNFGETGVDCGGPCAPCAVGLGCRASSDCAAPSLHDCVGGTCTRVYTVGAAVSFPVELSGGLGTELQLANGADRITVVSSGSFPFPTRTTGPYAVTIARQPQQAECSVGMGSGTASADVFVAVSCVRRFTIGGSVTGLPAGETVTLSNNGASPLQLSSDGPFVFPLQPAGGYAVTVTTQPMSATCVVTNGAGPAPTSDITTVSVVCSQAMTYSIGGTVSGLGAGKTLVLDNDGDQRSLTMNGSFTFTNRVTGAYTVTVATQPVGQQCLVTNDTGTATADVTNVTVVCTDLYTIGGTLSGLGASNTVTLSNAGEQLPLSMNGAFQFTTPVAGPYAVTVSTQPSGQTCTVQNGSGTATGNVTNVTVTCLGAPGRDTGFGTGGFTRVALTANFDAWQGLVVNPDGTLVLAGATEAVSGSTQWVVSKVTAAGAIDTSFGVNGHRTITAGTGQEQANALVRDGTGRYLVAGTLQGTSNLDIAVARLTTTGALDTTFGTNGVARFDLGGDDILQGLTLDSMGRIVVVGKQGLVGGDLVVARLTTAGALDSTFATNGRYLPTTGTGEELTGVVVDASNAVIAVGLRDQDSLVLKLTAAGVPDTTFGTGGEAVVDLSTGLFGDKLEAVALDGTRIVAAGTSLDSGASNFVIAGFTAAGALDTGFGAAGITVVGGATEMEALHALTPRPGGGWYAAGATDSSAAILRFTAAGALDTTFATNGQFTDAFGGSANAFATAVDGVGRIVIAGSFAAGAGASDLGIARINP